MLRKTGAIALIVVAALGLLLCVGGLVGAWMVNTPLTDSLTTVLDTGNEYLTLAGQTTEAAAQQLDVVKQRLDETGDRVANLTAEERAAISGEIEQTLRQEVGPLVSTLRTTISALRTGLIALNASLETANRIPGVNVPTLSDELQALDQRMQATQAQLAALTTSIQDLSVDGSQFVALTTSLSEQTAGVEAQLKQWRDQIDAASATMAATSASIPSIIDLTSVGLSLLLVLFGAGQVSLIYRGVALFRGS